MRKNEKKEGYEYSFKGGPLEQKQILDNGVPGPGAYNGKIRDAIPGFRIVQDTEKSHHDGDDKDGQGVGPQRYDPQYPAHTSVGAKFGTGVRDGMTQKFFTPAPNNYNIKSDFGGALEKPKFHMGIRTNNNKNNKNLDMPGPGEYETDTVPLHHQNLAHVIGTSLRSDLGIGKAHLFPGPGEYQP